MMKIEKYMSKPLDTNTIDFNKVSILEKYHKEIESLDEWILFADRKLLPDIRSLSKIIKNLYSDHKNFTAYRGIRYKDSISENLNIENPKIGNIGTYSSDIKPISFTTDIKIARAFGELIIETTINKYMNFLNITPELNYICCHCIGCYVVCCFEMVGCRIHTRCFHWRIHLLLLFIFNGVVSHERSRERNFPIRNIESDICRSLIFFFAF